VITLGLSNKWIDRMKSLPESGMGYQNVRVKLKNGVILKGIVTNSDVLKVDTYVIFTNYDIDEISPS